MGSLLDLVATTLQRASVWSLVDIFVVAVLIYGVLNLFRGTSGFSLLYGIALLLVAVALVSSVPNLVMLNWLLRNALPFVWLALLVVFQPELRRAMERIGRFRGLFSRQMSTADADSVGHAIQEIARASRRLSERRQGALIVMSRDTGLQEYVDTGVPIDGIVSVELLMTIFFPNSPLHDSSVIVHGNRVVAAGCVLPLSENVLDSQLGTRHRAAVGITEITDAIAVVVSEETGTISISNNGRLVRYLDETRLRKMLTILCGPRPHSPWQDWRSRWRRRAA